MFGCATTQPAFSPADVYEVPFVYPGSGIGGGALIASALQLPLGEEEVVASRALIEVLQVLNLSFPSTSLVIPLPQGTPLRTDTTTMDATVVRQHNSGLPENSPLRLSEDRLYGVQYELRYTVAGKSLRFFIMPHLYHRGTGSNAWREYNKDYSGTFFVGLVKMPLATALASESAKVLGQ